MRVNQSSQNSGKFQSLIIISLCWLQNTDEMQIIMQSNIKEIMEKRVLVPVTEPVRSDETINLYHLFFKDKLAPLLLLRNKIL